MPDGELELGGRPGPSLAHVADELSEIFARAGAGAGAARPEPGLRLPVMAAVLQRGDKRGPGVFVIGAVVFAALIGFGAGSLLNRPRPAPVSPELGTASLPERQVPGPVEAAAPPIAVAEAAAPRATEAPATEPAPVPAKPAQKAPAVVKKAAVRPPANGRLRQPYAKAAGLKPPIRLPVPTVPAAQPRSCSQDAAGEECRRAVVQADRHLRAVYETAIRRGVPGSTLVDYRDRWSELRDRETDNPTQLIQSYGALAYELGRESAHPDDQPDSPRRRDRSSLGAQADLPPPLR